MLLSRSAGAPPSACRPGLRFGHAPERRSPDERRSAPDRWRVRLARAALRSRDERGAVARSQAVAARARAIRTLDDPARAALLGRLRHALERAGYDEQRLAEALAFACEAAERVLGLTPRDGQRRAAEAMLRGRFVEMPTGEGKTLASAIAACVAALDGTPVHVLTANDYLARRDADRLAPLYASMGVRSACVLPTMDDHERRSAYAADVVHVTGKQVGFDWLRDTVSAGADADARSLVHRLGSLARRTARAGPPSAPLLRGLGFALVDEADSLLIDEARTPLVLARQCPVDAAVQGEAQVALGLARMLDRELDFSVRTDARQVRLTEQGEQTLERFAERFDGVWQATRYRDERVRQALSVLHLWHRDRDYIVRDGRVELVDENTGRPMPDRRLQDGLHGLLELKERCAATPENEVIAAIACQRLFRRYVRLAGTSGTLNEVRGELSDVFDARLTRLGHAHGSRLRHLPAGAFAGRAAQLDGLLAELRHCLAADRPVLVGTRSVAQSCAVATFLQAHGIAHHVLNARQDEQEALIVSRAGQPGRITVATNMAGRGTDIALGAGVAERGGLHVVSLGLNDARRIDRQLAGRAARQGAPGSFRQLLTLDDPALTLLVPERVLSGVRRWLDAGDGSRAAVVVVRLLAHLAQRRVEHRRRRERRAALDARERLAHHTAIGGDPDSRS